MNHLLAKKTGKNGEFVKLMSDEEIFNLPDDLDNPHVYDSDYNLDDDEWFAINDFSETDYAIDFITIDFNSAEYNQIANNDYTSLKYLCSYQDENYYYFQKLSSSQTVRKKWFKISNEPELVEDPIIIIKPYADAIYDRTQDILYFKNLASISTIFQGIDELYKEATQEDTEAFLQVNFIALVDDYSAEKVKKANRKRIAMAMNTFNNFSVAQKNQIFTYIKDYCGDLEFSDVNQNFEIGSEENLKQLLYGIEQRYYTTPIGKEKRLANSITAIN